MNVSVLGLGNWGTALAQQLASKGFDVIGWSIEEDVISGINSTNKNPKFLSEFSLHKNLRATGDLEEALKSKIIILVFPSQVLSEVGPKIKVEDDTILVSAIKGLERTTCQTPLQFLSNAFLMRAKLGVISGPSFARDVISGKPFGVVAASSEESVAKKIAEIFSSETMKVYTSTDPLGVELGGILKNVIAIAAGVSDGLGLGESARAGLITRGLSEMTRLSKALGANVQTFSGLSGLGDLAMTATSDLSRNRTVGVRLGKGESLPQIINSLGSVAEGVFTTPIVMELARTHKIDMPISQQVSKLISGEVTPHEMLKNLMTRPLKRETE